MKLLTIVIPVYNTNVIFLKECLNQFNKNYDSRIEVIIVDDGSKNITKQFLNTFKIACDNYIYHIKNSGQNFARQYGVNRSNGKYILFLDSDDLINWNSLQNILRYLELHDVDIFSFSGSFIDINSKIIKSFNFTEGWEDKRKYIANCAELWLQIYNKIFLQNNGGLYITKGAAVGEDMASVLPLALKSSSYYYLKTNLYLYRQNQDSIIHSASNDRRITVLESIKHIYNSIDMNSCMYRQEIEWQIIVHLIKNESLSCLESGFNGIPYASKMYNFVDENIDNWKHNIYLKNSYNIILSLCCNKHYIIIIFLLKFRKLFKSINNRLKHCLKIYLTFIGKLIS